MVRLAGKGECLGVWTVVDVEEKKYAPDHYRTEDQSKGFFLV